MATIRLFPTEVQVDDTVYVFDTAEIADAFEACVATVDSLYCESLYRPAEKRIADQESQ